MLQQLAVLVVRVAYRPVGKEASLIVSAGSLYHQSGDGAMDIGLTDNRNSLFVQQGVCRTRHDADLTLQRVPALDRDGIAGIFCSQIFHRNLQSCYIFQFFRFNLYAHIGIAVRNDVCYLGSFCFYFFHLFGQFRQRNRRKLNIKLLQQFAFVAHRGPEIERTRSDLQDSGMAERIDDVADGKEIFDAAFKFRIGQAAVRHIGKGDLESSEHFSGCEKSTLAVAETNTIFIRALIARSPKEYRQSHLFCQSCTDILGTEVAVREENSFYIFSFEFFLDLFTVRFIVKQAFLVDIGDVHKFNAKLFQTLSRQVGVFYGIRRTENASSRRGKSDFD